MIPPIEDYVRLLLMNDEEVVKQLATTDEGHPLIAVHHNVEGRFPSIELHVADELERQHAEDVLYTTYYLVEVNYFCEGSSPWSTMKPALDQAMRDAGFVKITSYSTRNVYTDVTEYTTQWRVVMTEEMLKERYEALETFVSNDLPSGTYFDEETETTIEIEEYNEDEEYLD